MVILPPEFVAIKHPGYFWHLKEQKLYTMKVTGVLRPLARTAPNYWNKYKEMYQISVDGQKRYLLVEKLKLLKAKNSVIPVTP